MKTLSINRGDFREVLEAFEPFKTHGSLEGVYGVIGAGYLPEPFRTEYYERNPHITYTVYSYATPIAWYDAEFGWIVPDVKYSTTTSKSQGRIRAGLGSGNYDTAPRV